MARNPDEIMTDFDAGCQGAADVDMRGVLWEVIDDILDSVKLACVRFDGTRGSLMEDIHGTVVSYVSNHYGDD